MTKLKVGFVGFLLLVAALAISPRYILAPTTKDLKDGERLLDASLWWSVETTERVDAWILAEVGAGEKLQQDAGVRKTPYRFVRMVEPGDPIRLRIDTAGWYAHTLGCRAWIITKKGAVEVVLTRHVQNPGTLIECRGVVT